MGVVGVPFGDHVEVSLKVGWRHCINLVLLIFRAFRLREVVIWRFLG